MVRREIGVHKYTKRWCSVTTMPSYKKALPPFQITERILFEQTDEEAFKVARPEDKKDLSTLQVKVHAGIELGHVET